MGKTQSENSPLKYHEEIELTIDNITNLGYGVGRYNHWVVMVPYVCKGEKVLCRVYRNHPNYSEADLLKVIVPSPERVTPRCPLFGLCGGCQYQHIQYSVQQELKRQQVQELLLRLAKIDVPVQPLISQEPVYGYRSKLTPHFQRDVTKIGFLKTGSRHDIVDVSECPIASEEINITLQKMRQDLIGKPQKRGGTLLLRDTTLGVITDAKQIASQSIRPYTFLFYAGEFFQNNPYILPKFVDYITSEASDSAINFLIDAYCGVGVFGICGSSKFESVIGIEINENAIKLAQENAKNNQIKNISFLSGSAEHLFIEDNLPPSDKTSIIIDPPRKGCDMAFLNQLVTFGPKKIVYVSCAPDTQARDLTFLLQKQYRIDKVQPFDLFPQTRHIENVVTLTHE